MKTLQNPFRGSGLAAPALDGIPDPSTDATRVQALLARCPRAAETPLREVPGLATAAGVGRVFVKDERNRMGLGSFKALGAAYVIACDAGKSAARGTTYVTASAGNHGLSVAAGAAAFGATARIYIAETVPEAFADRLRAHGAQVTRAGATYEDSMAAAARAAADHGWVLLSDSSWPGYTTRPHTLMEGYLALIAEAGARMPVPPSHIFLQAGVGGFAGAVAAYARRLWADAPVICVVEPDFAPALQASIAAGAPVTAAGPVSVMGRLDCKEPSFIALRGLARDADDFLLITEEEALAATRTCAGLGLPTTPSGAAGVAALLSSGPHRTHLALTDSSTVLAVLTEGPEEMIAESDSTADTPA